MRFILEESIKNTYEFTVIRPDDSHFTDEIDAYSNKQAVMLARKKHKGCYIRNFHQVTYNEDPDGVQLTMFED